MPQDTTRRNEFQGTRREGTEIGRGGTRRYKLMRPRPRGTDVKENIDWVERELEMIWNGLRGGGGAKDIINSGHRLSQALDQYGRPTRLYDNGNNEWRNAEDIGVAVDAATTLSREFFVPAQEFETDPGATNPATWASVLASSRFQGWEIPTGSSNIFFWSSRQVPASWTDLKCRTRVIFGLKDAPITASAVYMNSSGFGYDDAQSELAPTVLWNEADTIDIESLAIAKVYSRDWVETGNASPGGEDWVAVRLAFPRTNAAYTYTGSIYLYGVHYTFEEAA